MTAHSDSKHLVEEKVSFIEHFQAITEATPVGNLEARSKEKCGLPVESYLTASFYSPGTHTWTGSGIVHSELDPLEINQQSREVSFPPPPLHRPDSPRFSQSDLANSSMIEVLLSDDSSWVKLTVKAK